MKPLWFFLNQTCKRVSGFRVSSRSRLGSWLAVAMAVHIALVVVCESLPYCALVVYRVLNIMKWSEFECELAGIRLVTEAFLRPSTVTRGSFYYRSMYSTVPILQQNNFDV
jgi:hypothetical protein